MIQIIISWKCRVTDNTNLCKKNKTNSAPVQQMNVQSKNEILKSQMIVKISTYVIAYYLQ